MFSIAVVTFCVACTVFLVALEVRDGIQHRRRERDMQRLGGLRWEAMWVDEFEQVPHRQRQRDRTERVT